jgi:hypothetical protein
MDSPKEVKGSSAETPKKEAVGPGDEKRPDFP